MTRQGQRTSRRIAPPSGSRWAVLVPATLAAVMFGPVVGTTVAQAVLIPVVVLSAGAMVLVRRGSTGAPLVGGAVAAVGEAAAAAFVVALLVGPTGPGPVAAGIAAGAVSLGSSLGQLLLERRPPALAALPPVLAATVALALGAATAPGQVLLAAALVVGTALVLVVAGPWNGGSHGGGSSATPTRGGLLLAAVATFVAGAVALGAGTSARTWMHDPVRFLAQRADETPPQTGTLRDVSPLTQATRWQTVLRDDDRTLVGLGAPVQASRVIWTTLDRYDGRTWSPPLLYPSKGPVFPPDPVAGIRPSLAQELRLVVGPALPGPWIPTQTRVTQVDGTPAWSDTGVGSVISSGSPIGRPVRVLSSQPVASRTELAAAPAAPAAAFSSTLALPGPLPPVLRHMVDSAAEVGPNPWDRLAALARELRAPRMDPADLAIPSDVVPGRSYQDLDEVLAKGVGFQEQYAAAFALGARDWNVPTRLAVGWLTPASAFTPVYVTAASTSVWVQVQLAGIGWVSFQPTPQDRDAGRPAVVLPPSSLPTVKPTSRPTATASPSSSPSRSPSASPTPKPEPAGGSTWWTWLLLLVPLAWPLSVAWRRRSRRRALEHGPADGRGRVGGAWTWARTALWEGGLPLPPGVSPDVVALGDGADDLPREVAERLRALAATVSPVLYAPEPASDEQVRAAWDQADAVVAAVHSGAGPRARIRRLLLPGRPLPDPGEPAWDLEDDFGPAARR